MKPVDIGGAEGFSMVAGIRTYRGIVRGVDGIKFLWVQADGAWSQSNTLVDAVRRHLGESPTSNRLYR